MRKADAIPTGIALVGLCLVAFSYFTYGRYDWTPVAETVNLGSGQSNRFTFTAQRTIRYELDLIAFLEERVIERYCEELSENFKDGLCTDPFDSIVIGWSIYEDGELIANRATSDVTVSYRETPPAIAFSTYIEAKEGAVYTVTFEVLRGADWIEKVSPEIDFKIEMHRRLSVRMMASAAENMGIALLALAVFIWVTSFVISIVITAYRRFIARADG